MCRPNIRLELTYLHSPAQRDKILQDQIDFGFIETSFQRPEIETSPITHHRLVALLPPKHPLAAKDSLTLEELARGQLVMTTYSEWPALRRIVVAFQSAGQVMTVAQEAPSLFGILGLITAEVASRSPACHASAASRRSHRVRSSPIRR
jgi:DNA-binding transcriptional LysR family regulator